MLQFLSLLNFLDFPVLFIGMSEQTSELIFAHLLKFHSLNVTGSELELQSPSRVFLIHMLTHIIKEVCVVIWGPRDRLVRDFLAVTQQESAKSRNTICLPGFAMAVAFECGNGCPGSSWMSNVYLKDDICSDTRSWDAWRAAWGFTEVFTFLVWTVIDDYTHSKKNYSFP